MIRFKPEVRIGSFGPPIALVLDAAARWSLSTGVEVEINSINDSHAAHSPTSLHQLDLAVDLDTAGDRPDDLAALARYLAHWLPAPYQVIRESDHVHVEHDPTP